jgi:hypothetical protein
LLRSSRVLPGARLLVNSHCPLKEALLCKGDANVRLGSIVNMSGKVIVASGVTAGRLILRVACTDRFLQAASDGVRLKGIEMALCVYVFVSEIGGSSHKPLSETVTTRFENTAS